MSGSLGEREMLWEHDLQVSVSTAFSSSPKLSRMFLLLTYYLARALIGQKPMFYQSIKHRKSVFYCFARVKSIF